MATRYTDTPENLRFLSSRLREGDLVAVPTETVYGLGADARNEAACREIFRAKERPPEDPLIVHIPEAFDLREIARPGPLLGKLREAFWPGPLTVVMDKTAAIPDIVTASLPSVAVRMPAHPALRALLAEFGGPLAAPSANPFAYISPTSADHVEESLGQRIRYILDGGLCRHGVESTILDIRDPACPVLLRHGAIPVEELEETLGQTLAYPAEDAPAARAAPGQMPKHYSPKTPLDLIPAPLSVNDERAGRNIAFLFFRKPDSLAAGDESVFWLSEQGRLEEAAANLFSLLREIDNRGYSTIIAEAAPDYGLGRAINDRLRRAAVKRRTPCEE